MFVDSLFLSNLFMGVLWVIILICSFNKSINIKNLNIISIGCIIFNVILLGIYNFGLNYLNVGLEVVFYEMISIASIVVFGITFLIMLGVEKSRNCDKPNYIVCIFVLFISLLIVGNPLIKEISLLNNCDYYIVGSSGDLFADIYNIAITNGKSYDMSLSEKFMKNGKKVELDEENCVSYYDGRYFERENNKATDKEKSYINKIINELENKNKDNLPEVDSYYDGEYIIASCGNKTFIYNKDKLIIELNYYMEVAYIIAR